MKIEYQKNVICSYSYSFWSFFGITSLWVIYLQQQGLSLVEIGLCESIFHLASFLFELPSGVLADRFSYKSVLIAGRIMAIASAAIMLIGGSFWVYAGGFILSAFSYNLQSGTLEALIYDSLLERQQNEFYPQIAAHLNMIFEFADTSGVVLAGLLVHWHFGLTYVIEILISCLALFSVLLVREPTLLSKLPKKQPAAVSTSQILLASWKVLQQQPQLRNLMIFQALFDAICTSYYFYFQTLMENKNFTGWLISAVLVLAAVINIFAMQFAPHIKAKFAVSTLMIWLAASLLILVTCWFNQLPILLGIFLLVQALSSISEPIFSSYYNETIPSEQRATLLSVASVFFSLSMVVIFPLLGWLIEKMSFAAAFGSLGGLLLLLLGGIWIRNQIVVD
ncbi:MAG: MFS transporter [Liquorilactobacillus nagelii]|jgi:MFS family permease|uniref:MFS transporter n=1 Tax=Liquorilactobacillus nagelii TaxID=82688 RepID=UPI00242E51B7|nr:MFS transporter [Liquorilactobacillus nagelii]MCI1633072.1 MFS transporter [Liquorilactobacillus nagelii]MCI1920962.1 MFS transporter [Liquorilactobacillus nagelii]MCI1975845.1 MFS transporter [Liquorilactobacillus nagelii]